MEKKKTVTIEDLLSLLAKQGGVIVSSASCDTEEIRQANASGRMYVDPFNLGFIWNPCITKFPTTDKEVEFFEQWYPLDIEVDQSYFDDMLKKIFNKINPHGK